MIITFVDGNSQATIDLKDKKSGFRVDFNRVDNPNFITKVGQLLDEFMWTDKTVDDCFKIDTFERSKGNGKN